MKFVIFALMLLFVPEVFGIVYIPPPTPPSQSSGCMPPVDFVVEHHCSLSLRSAYSPLEYMCTNNEGSWDLIGDCKGGVLQEQFHENVPFWKSPGQIIFAGLLVYLVYWMFKSSKEPLDF